MADEYVLPLKVIEQLKEELRELRTTGRNDIAEKIKEEFGDKFLNNFDLEFFKVYGTNVLLNNLKKAYFVQKCLKNESKNGKI